MSRKKFRLLQTEEALRRLEEAPIPETSQGLLEAHTFEIIVPGGPGTLITTFSNSNLISVNGIMMDRDQSTTHSYPPGVCQYHPQAGYQVYPMLPFGAPPDLDLDSEDEHYEF